MDQMRLLVHVAKINFDVTITFGEDSMLSSAEAVISLNPMRRNFDVTGVRFLHRMRL